MTYARSDLYLSYTGFMKYDSCSEAYKLEYLEKQRAAVEDARNNIHGNVLHNLLDEWMKRGKFEPEWLTRNAERAWQEQVAKEKLISWRNGTDEQTVFDKTMKWAGTLAELVEKYKIDPASCESEYKADTTINLGGKKIRMGGRIDVIKTNKAGDKIVLDLKASVNRDIMKKDQLVWYATLVGMSLGDHSQPVAAGYILPGLDEMVMHRITQEEKLALMNRLLKVTQKIFAKDFKPQPAKDRCFWCPVKHACPAVGLSIPSKTGILDLAEFL